MSGLAVFIMAAASFAGYRLLPPAARDSRTLLVFLGVVAAHHAVSVANVLVGPLPGSDLDANTFHVNAANAVARGLEPGLSIGTGAYEWVLYLLYRLTGPAKLVGQTLSVLVYSLGLAMIVRMACRLRVPVSYPVAVLMVGLMPSGLFFASLTFREVFQLVGIVAGVLAWTIAMDRGQARWLAASFAGLVGAGLFHHVLMAMAVLVFGVGACAWFAQRAGSWRKAATGAALILAAVAVSGVILVTNVPTSSGNDYVRMLQRSGGVVEMVANYRQAVDSANPRSSYGFEVDTGTLHGLGLGLIKSYGYYLAGPMPWQVGRDVDWVPFLNSLLRLLGVAALVYLAAMGRLGGRGWFLVFVFFGITFMWSVGTTNFGQAFRHHALTDWIPALWIGMAAALVCRNRGRPCG